MNFEEYIETYRVLWHKWVQACKEEDWETAKRVSTSIHVMFESARDRSDFVHIITETRKAVTLPNQ